MTRLLATIVLGGMGLGLLAVFGWWAFIRSVETPPHTVEVSEGRFELRRYARWVVAEVERGGARLDALRAGFRPLAGYIFAKHREGEAVAMTAPVIQERTGPRAESVGSNALEGRWQVRFVMPSQRDRAALPDPAQADVSLHTLPARRVAAVRFSGRASDADFLRREAELRAWAERRGLEPDGQAMLAYYDDPLVPGPLRRNEVLLPVKTSTRAAS